MCKASRPAVCPFLCVLCFLCGLCFARERATGRCRRRPRARDGRRLHRRRRRRDRIVVEPRGDGRRRLHERPHRVRQTPGSAIRSHRRRGPADRLACRDPQRCRRLPRPRPELLPAAGQRNTTTSIYSGRVGRPTRRGSDGGPFTLNSAEPVRRLGRAVPRIPPGRGIDRQAGERGERLPRARRGHPDRWMPQPTSIPQEKRTRASTSGPWWCSRRCGLG